jgi:hypothetical protein
MEFRMRNIRDYINLVERALTEASDGYYVGVMIDGQDKFILLDNDGPYPTAQAALDRGVLAALKYEWVGDNQWALGDPTPDDRKAIALDKSLQYDADDTDDDEEDEPRPYFDFDEYGSMNVNYPHERWGAMAVFQVGEYGTVLVKDGRMGPRDFSDDFNNFLTKTIGNSHNR